MSYKVIQVQEHLWSIEKDFVRCYLLEGESSALLIDTLVEGGDLMGQCKELTSLPISVINTHADWDHIGCNKQFDYVRMHPSEFSFYIESPLAGVKPDPVWEAEVIDIGRFKLEVLLLPGHTPGSIALLEREKRFLIGGDVLHLIPVYLYGEGRSVEAYISSLTKLESMANEFDRIYTSHGPMEIEPDVIGRLKDCAQQALDGNICGAIPSRKEPEGVLAYRLNDVSVLLKK